MAYDAPDAAGSDDLLGKVEQETPDLPSERAQPAPPTDEQIRQAPQPPAPPDHGSPATAAEAARQVDRPPAEAAGPQLGTDELTDEPGTGLTGGPLGT